MTLTGGSADTVRGIANLLGWLEDLGMSGQVRSTSSAESTLSLVESGCSQPLRDRELLEDRLATAIALAERYDELVALVIVDLNRSTEARAALGLASGEQLTEMVGEHLRLDARRSDTVALIGSDLFAIVMPRVESLPQMLGLTKRLIRLFDRPWELDSQVLYLSPGIGVAYYPANGLNGKELVRAAVAAASHAARSDTRRLQLVDPEWHALARDRLDMEVELRRALKRQELVLYYQPQVSAVGGCVSGFEALVRWRHPSRGLVSPGEFIPLAEETHLIVPIGTWVIGEACRQLAVWRRQGLPATRVAVNLAAEQLDDEHLLTVVESSLTGHALSPDSLEIEITERTALADEAQTASALAELQTLGVRLTLDDFGTGYSSASALRSYHFDTLKIDRSFVSRTVEDERERAITQAIIALGHAARMTVVAEGVETAEELRLLRDLGADEIQGYFFSRPMPAAECEPFLLSTCDVDHGGIAAP